MKKSRFSEAKIISVLKRNERGEKVHDLCREVGISDATFYNWKAKYGGLSVSDLKRLKDLEAENARLKKMYANLSLVHDALKDAVEKTLSPGEKRMLVTQMNAERGVSIRQGCRAVGLARSTYRYEPTPKQDEAVIDALNVLVAKHPAIGFWQAHHRLRLEGRSWNHKRVYRIYTALELNIRRRAKKRLPARVKKQLFQPEEPNQVWSLDYIHDSLWDGRTFRMLNVLDDYNRQVLRIEADTCLPAQRVIRVLEQLEESRGLPSMLRVDNGPEFISRRLDTWCKDRKITLAYIQPGKPTQNAYVERLNGSIRRELLNAYVSGPSMRSEKRLRSGSTTTTTAGRTNHWGIKRQRTCFLSNPLLLAGPDNGEAYTARERGRTGGRPRALDEEDIPQVQSLMQNEDVSTRQICERFGISKATLYRYVGPNGEKRC